MPGIDLVLGGHDHEYHCLSVEHQLKDTNIVHTVKNKVVPVVKSATDFLDFSEIDVTLKVSES